MKKILASDNSLKIISVLTAICIWVYIAIIKDPSIEVTVRDLPIQFIGQEVLNSKGLAVISESNTTVTVKIKGNRKKLGNNDMKSIIVKADESVISDVGNQNIPIEIIIPFENHGVSTQSLYTVDVNVERVKEKEVPVQLNNDGKLAENYISGDIVKTPEMVKIKGPESAVEKIDSAIATLEYNGEDVDIDTDIPIAFCGKDGKEISSLDAILTRITPSENSIHIHCPVLKIRKVEPKASFGTQIIPEGFKYKLEPSELFIYGDDPDVAKINEIFTDEISVRKLLDNDKLKVKLAIPQGVKVVDDVSEVEISVEKK